MAMKSSSVGLFASLPIPWRLGLDIVSQNAFLKPPFTKEILPPLISSPSLTKRRFNIDEDEEWPSQ